MNGASVPQNFETLFKLVRTVRKNLLGPRFLCSHTFKRVRSLVIARALKEKRSVLMLAKTTQHPF